MRRKVLIVLNSGAAIETPRQYSRIKKLYDVGGIMQIKGIYKMGGAEYVCTTDVKTADISYIANLMSKKPFEEKAFNSHRAKKKAIQREMDAMQEEEGDVLETIEPNEEDTDMNA